MASTEGMQLAWAWQGKKGLGKAHASLQPPTQQEGQPPRARGHEGGGLEGQIQNTQQINLPLKQLKCTELKSMT